MSEYIKKEDALKTLIDAIHNDGFAAESGIERRELREDEIEDTINAIPAEDVERVVRCKACEKTHAPFPNGNFYCTKFGCAVKPDFFCADGEPKIDHSVQYRPCGR